MKTWRVKAFIYIEAETGEEAVRAAELAIGNIAKIREGSAKDVTPEKEKKDRV